MDSGGDSDAEGVPDDKGEGEPEVDDEEEVERQVELIKSILRALPSDKLDKYIT